MLWMKPREGNHLIFFTQGVGSPGSGSASRVAAWCLACLLSLGCTGAWADVFHIDSVRINAPKILNDSLIYTMDIHFLEHPGPFWSYYDQANGMIVVEFLDASVLAPPVKFARGMPFLGFKVRKAQSEMALTRVVSRVTVYVDRGQNGERFWNNDTRLVGNSTVRIVIWKEKTAHEKIKGKKSRVVAISVGASVLVLFIVIAIFAL